MKHNAFRIFRSKKWLFSSEISFLSSLFALLKRAEPGIFLKCKICIYYLWWGTVMILFQHKCHSHIVIPFGLAEGTFFFSCLHLIPMLQFRIFHRRIMMEPINWQSRIYWFPLETLKSLLLLLVNVLEQNWDFYFIWRCLEICTWKRRTAPVSP